MSKMISIASGFQYSVNIGYDLNNEEKIQNFIPTASAIRLLEDILISTFPSSTERARVLIGAYGKGKSHIMLMILSMLMKKDISLFSKTINKIEGTKLHQSIVNYYESENKILPVIISGSNTSLTQAFLMALQRTLSENNLLDIMPETNYKAAISTIQRWQREFPETYQKFCEQIDMPVEVFVESLENFNTKAYQDFEAIYPLLTAGSIFNPFLGFDVVELYENAAKGLKSRGFSGIFVVYDEFSKYLEANIASASVSDTKMLQDFAEKCNRSGNLQMHIMLISHKEIANYIDVLPKQKVDGWRGVSERFLHVRLSNNFTQTYEIIESVIQKNNTDWIAFCQAHENEFESLYQLYENHPIFAGMSSEEIGQTMLGCYPLHPVSTFILPRLSERVAQNERTLFTFLSANGVSTLPSYLESYDDTGFQLITPDRIYDYFEPLFKKEVYSGSLHDNYILTEIILEQLEPDTLASRIIKIISLFYILEQFDKLKPTIEEVCGIFSAEHSPEEIKAEIDDLIAKEYVVYLKRSNQYLQLKQSSGVDIQSKISDVVESQKGSITIDSALNDVNYDSYMYPSRYNDHREMVRYFSFQFIKANDVVLPQKVESIIEDSGADGIVFGVLPENQDSIMQLKSQLLSVSQQFQRAVFVLPKSYREIESIVREYRAVISLRDQAVGDKVLFNEYEVIYEDLRDLMNSFVSGFTRPELFQAIYIYNGNEQTIRRKSALTELLSTICDEVYSNTPVINNEALNRNEATSIAKNSRNKVVAGLLRSELEPNLGLTGTGQDISIMRSTLIRTGILENADDDIHINLHPERLPQISEMMGVIEEFIRRTRTEGALCFSVLYELLCSPNNKIALRRELVPIFLAAVLHEYKKNIVISDQRGQVQLLSDTITQINAVPENYYLDYLDWNPEKANFLRRMDAIFETNISEAQSSVNPYDYMVFAMKRWYISLPKYVKDMTLEINGEPIERGYLAFRDLFRRNPSGYAFLFSQVPNAFGYVEFVAGVADNIQAAKHYFDNAIGNLKLHIIDSLKHLFAGGRYNDRTSLTAIVRDWCELLDDRVFEQVFPDGADRCLSLLRTITNDEDTFVTRLVKAATGLRLEDWDDHTLHTFIETITRCRDTAEQFHPDLNKQEGEQIADIDSYQVVFVDAEGNTETKRFERVPTAGRAKLLMNKITSELNSFGEALTEAEKRQVIMEILRKLC